MVRSCSAFGCTTRSSKEETVFRFPMRYEGKKKEWEKALRREGFTATLYSGVCYKHFKPDDFKEKSTRLRLKPDAVPTIFESFPPYVQTEKRSLRKILKKESTSGVEPVYCVPSTSTYTVLSNGNKETKVELVDEDDDDDNFVEYYTFTKTEFKRLNSYIATSSEYKRQKMSEKMLNDLKRKYKLKLEFVGRCKITTTNYQTTLINFSLNYIDWVFFLLFLLDFSRRHPYRGCTTSQLVDLNSGDESTTKPHYLFLISQTDSKQTNLWEKN
uniref:THAP domain-containing protein 1 n=1 Tax=Cacopsylla melanoneura TaxID=428564 RepID=A0A8D9FKP9_9HEMI